jgi:hypothetical protein
VLPAFRLAQAWSRENGIALNGLLQVGDLGDSRFDIDGRRHSERDTLESGMRLVARPSEEAESVFSEEDCPETMWFTAGNHEDYTMLRERERRDRRAADHFVVDAYGKLRCIRDGRVTEVSGGLRIGALWGIDGRAPGARERIPSCARISRRSAAALSCARFDVLLSHESPRDAVLVDHGSEEIGTIIRSARPTFAFFGHYHRTGRKVEGDFGSTRVYHLSHLELDSRAEEGSVGVVTWDKDSAGFQYLDPAWLRTVSRHNWRHR